MLRGLLVVVATAVGLIVVVVGVVGLGLHRLSSAQRASDENWQPPKLAAQADVPPAPPVADAEGPPEPRPLSIVLWAGDAVGHGRVHCIDRDKARQARMEEARDVPGDWHSARRLRHEMMAGHPVASFLAGWQDLDDWAEWTVELPKAGDYEIDLTYALPKMAQGGEFIVKIADKSITFRPELTRGPQSFRMSTLGRMTLPAGKSTITLRAADRLPGDRPSLSVRSLQVIPSS